MTPEQVVEAFRPKPTKKDCVGCRDNYYNMNHDGCWSFQHAVMVDGKDIPIDMPPPYTHIPNTRRPSCFCTNGYVRVKASNLTSDGYWK